MLLLQCMKNISRNTAVISVSLPKQIAKVLEKDRKAKGQSRSAYVASLIEKVAEEERWQKIYKRGEQTARDFRITSEDDIDRILHGA